MTRHASTLEDLNRIIHALYEAAVLPELWPAALETMGDGLGGCALGMTIQANEGATEPLALARLDADCMEVMFRQYANSRTNAMVAAMSELPTAVAAARQTVITDPDYFGSGLYNEVFRPQDLAHAAVACAFRSRDYFVPLGIFRRGTQAEFGGHEHALLKLLLPHLRRALQIYLRVDSLRSQQDATDTTLDRLPFGLVFFDSAGRVWKLNRPAEAIMAEKDGLVIQNGELRAASTTENKELRTLILSAAAVDPGTGPSSGDAMAISRPSLKRSLSILIVPLPASNVDVGLNRPCAVAFVADAARNTSPSEDTVMRLLCLTSTEAKVACMLVAGLTIEEIAQRLGNKPSTVRVHVKTIFGKTDTSRQSDLVRAILNSVAALSSR